MLVGGSTDWMILMTALVQQRKSLVLILVKQRQSVAWVCFITVVVIVICLIVNSYF